MERECIRGMPQAGAPVTLVIHAEAYPILPAVREEKWPSTSKWRATRSSRSYGRT